MTTLANFRDFLNDTHCRFQIDSDLSLVVGAELEFYVSPATHSQRKVVVEEINSAMSCELGLQVEVKDEVGDGQYEISFPPTKDLVTLADQIVRCRHLVEHLASKNGTLADFRARPFVSQPGSALHIHLSLSDSRRSLSVEQGQRVFDSVVQASCGSINEAMGFLRSDG